MSQGRMIEANGCGMAKGEIKRCADFDDLIFQQDDLTCEQIKSIPPHLRADVFRLWKRHQIELLKIERENDDKFDEQQKQWLKDNLILDALRIHEDAMGQLARGTESFVYRDKGEAPEVVEVEMRAKSRKDEADVALKAAEAAANLAGLGTGSAGGTTVDVNINVRSAADQELAEWRKQQAEQLQVSMEASMPALPAPPSASVTPASAADWLNAETAESQLAESPPNGSGTQSSSPNALPTPPTSRIPTVS